MVKCRYCGKSFESKDELKQHVLKTHTMVSIFGEGILDPRIYDPLGLAGKIRKRKKL
ncbi:MAG: C2H2-type zinc finger protein [Archaeoglobaceae archaeon]|nr:C2H2-type zinc finger protein [Archaeoglobaceae archaeon]